MRPRDNCIINNNGTNWYFAFLKAISASCKAFFIKYSSVKIFSIKQKYSNLFVHLPYVKIYFQVFITLRFTPTRRSTTSSAGTKLRDFIIDIVSVKEGHLGASLGVIELTIALHYVFNTPDDLLVFGM
jgi:hypothetical protein